MKLNSSSVNALSDYLAGRRVRSIELTSNGWQIILDDRGEIHLIATTRMHSKDWAQPELLSETEPVDGSHLDAFRGETISLVAPNSASDHLVISFQSGNKSLSIELDESLVERLVVFPPEPDGFFVL